MSSLTEELNVKLHRIRQWLARQDAAAILIRRRPNFSWITCGGQSHIATAADVGAAAVLITPDRLFLIASNIEIERLANEQTADLPFNLLSFPWHDPLTQNRMIAEIVGAGRLAADAPPSDISADDALKQLRASLLPAEMDRVAQLGRLTTQITESTCRQLEPGWTECQVAAEIHHQALAQGARVPVCLIAADKRIALYRHPLPTRAAIQQQAMVVVCIERQGLICSATRMVSFKPLDAELRRRHRGVCQVDAAAISATRIGCRLSDIFHRIKAVYAEQGYAEQWQYHHQGGATGYQPRDLVANETTEATVQPCQLFAWNPSIAGTKSEDTILITPQGLQWITAPGADWPALEIERDGETFRRADILVRT